MTGEKMGFSFLLKPSLCFFYPFSQKDNAHYKKA